MPLSSLAARTSAIWLQFLPITIGALALLQLVQFPLAVRLARQTARARRERELMLYRSLAASDAERRRIAADLHDGVVQDLAATSIALAGAAVEADRAGSRDESGRLHVAADAVRAAIRSLRSLVVDIHPPNLRRTGLAAALGDLAATTTARGVAVTLVVDDGATRRLDGPTEQFAFRVAQEALRNVVAHADATAVEIRLSRRPGADGDLLTLAVTDDGSGFDPSAVVPDDRPHLGLRLLDDLAGDVGGRIDVTPGARRRDDPDDGGSGLVIMTRIEATGPQADPAARRAARGGHPRATGRRPRPAARRHGAAARPRRRRLGGRQRGSGVEGLEMAAALRRTSCSWTCRCRACPGWRRPAGCSRRTPTPPWWCSPRSPTPTSSSTRWTPARSATSSKMPSGRAGRCCARRGARESPLDPRAARIVLTGRAKPAPVSVLSGREKEVLVLVAEGLANKQIARTLGIAERTVKAHLTSVFTQIGVTDRTSAALWAHRRGLVGSPPRAPPGR